MSCLWLWFSSDGSGERSSKQNKAVELLPVDLESKSDRQLKAYSPVFIHNCLEKCIGSSKSCSPLANGNLIANCCSLQQMKTFLKCTKLTDGAVTVEVAASPLQLLGARGVIYNVPLDISTEDILACLPSQGVQSVCNVYVSKVKIHLSCKTPNLYSCSLTLLTSLVR